MSIFVLVMVFASAFVPLLVALGSAAAEEEVSWTAASEDIGGSGCVV